MPAVGSALLEHTKPALCGPDPCREPAAPPLWGYPKPPQPLPGASAHSLPPTPRLQLPSAHFFPPPTPFLSLAKGLCIKTHSAPRLPLAFSHAPRVPSGTRGLFFHPPEHPSPPSLPAPCAVSRRRKSPRRFRFCSPTPCLFLVTGISRTGGNPVAFGVSQPQNRGAEEGAIAEERGWFWHGEAPTPRSGSQPALAMFFGLAHVTPALWIPLTPKFQSLAAARAFSWSCARQRHTRGVGVGPLGSCQLLYFFYFYFLFIFFLLKFEPLGSCSFLPCCCQPGQEEATGALPWVPSKARAGMGRVPREPGGEGGSWKSPPALAAAPSPALCAFVKPIGSARVMWVLPTCPAPLPSNRELNGPSVRLNNCWGCPVRSPPLVPRWQLQPLRCPQGLRGLGRGCLGWKIV